MAEGLPVIGLIANIVQLVDFSLKIIRRINEFKSSTAEIPRSFCHIKTELPLLQETLQQTKKAVDAGSLEYQEVLAPAIENCLAQIKQLNDIVEKTLPASDDSKWRKGKKALISVLQQDAKVANIQKRLRGLTQTLTFYYVATASILKPFTGMINTVPAPWVAL